MGQTGITLTALHTAYETWLEVPVAISEFRHIASDDNLPTELDVLFFQPREEDVIEDSFFTYLVTAGMSTRTLEGPDRQIELGLQVVGRYEWDALHVLAIRLSELALAPYYQDALYAPNQIVRDVSLPLFDGMDCMLITDWSISPPPDYLPGLTLPVRLLRIQPLFTHEADIVDTIDAREAYRRFRAEGIDWNAPHRPPALLDELPSYALTPTVVTSINGISEGTGIVTNEETLAIIKDIWHDIESWYKNHALRQFEDLKSGASDAQIESLRSDMSVVLPEDYRASLQTHNGNMSFHDYEYLTCNAVLRKWKMMAELGDEGAFAGRSIDQDGKGIIQDTWWNRGWIPFVADSGGNMMCIDTMPATEGVVGQVLRMEKNSGPFPTQYSSFRAWLEDYRDGLYQGKYKVDDDGFIESA